jgi:cytochrome bd-type quinol oxidase subunit 2
VFDWYTLLVAAFGVVALGLHGAVWLCARTDGEVFARSRKLLLPLFVATLLLLTAVSGATLAVNAKAGARLLATGPGLGIATLCVVLFGAGAWFARRERFAPAFRASAAFLVVLVLGAAWALFPHALHARTAGRDVSIARVATAEATLSGMLWWWLPGVTLAAVYTWFAYRRLPKTFGIADTDEH